MKTRIIYSRAISILFFVFALNTHVCGQASLVKAIREGDIEKANKIVDKSSAEDLNQIVTIKMPSGTTNITFPLCEAVRISDSLLVKKILKKGANPNQITFISPYYFTPLMKASENNDLASVKYLVENGANINYQLDKQGKEYLLGFEIGKTALHFAAEKNSAEVAEFLIKSGANVNIKNVEGKTPLMKAVTFIATNAQKESALANKALYFSEKVKNTPNYQESFLLGSRYFNVICVLLNNNADINVQDTAGNTALHYAIMKLDKYNDTRTAIHQLLSYNPNVNIANNEGNTPLLLSLRSDLLFESNLLLYLKADVTTKNKARESVFDAIIETDRRNNFSMDGENATIFVANLKRLFAMGAKDSGSGLLYWLSIDYTRSYLKNDIVDLIGLSLNSGSDPNFSIGEKYSSVIDYFIKAYQQNPGNGNERYYTILEMLINGGATNIAKKEVVMLKSIYDCDDKLVSLLIKNKKQFSSEQLQRALDEANKKIIYLNTKNLAESNIESKIEKTNRIVEMLQKAVADSN